LSHPVKPKPNAQSCAGVDSYVATRHSPLATRPTLARFRLTGPSPPTLQVYAAGSEDMDTLTFNSPVVLRHLTFSEARKMPIDVISLPQVLTGLELTMDQFIDMCMLCGCDYLEPIKGIGAKTALKLVKEHDSLAEIVDKLNEGKNKVPDEWPYAEARELFKQPLVTSADEIKENGGLVWKAPDVEGLVEFLVTRNGFA